MSLDRTVKWIDKTGNPSSTQRAATSSARPSSTPAGSSSIASRWPAIRKPPRSSKPSSVSHHLRSQHARREEAVPIVQERERGQEDQGPHQWSLGYQPGAEHTHQGLLFAVLVLRQPQHPLQDQAAGLRPQEDGQDRLHFLADRPGDQPGPARAQPARQPQEVQRPQEVPPALLRTYYSSASEEQTTERKKEYKAALLARNAIYLNIIKVAGDVIPAGQGSEFFPNVLGITANDSACGLGGLISALLTSYQLYE